MIKRSLFSKIKDHLPEPEITLIVGPRQAGKTTLMLMLKEYLESRDNKTVFFSLDTEADKEHFDSQEEFLKAIQLQIGDSKGFVFIDEIQRKEDAGVFLKGIYDMNLPYKFIVSGSGSLELKEKIYESLVGRKQTFRLTTLSFVEFVNHRTDYKYEKKLSEFFKIEKSKADLLLEEYLNFGGYPRVVLADTIDKKTAVINDIYQSYLMKDISYLLKITKTDKFSDLVKILSNQPGRLVNYSELSSTLGMSVNTVKDYLWSLEKTFILNRSNPFFKNARKEITKSPLYYFEDLGLMNFVSGKFGMAQKLENIGFLFQNFVFKLLDEKTRLTPYKVQFWRTSDGAEIDFVFNKVADFIPLEVKSRALKKPTVPRALRSFVEKYESSKAYVVNQKLRKSFEMGVETRLKFVPVYDLLFEDL